MGPGRLVLSAGLLMAVPYRYFFNTARMMMLANLLTGIYLTLGCSCLWKMTKAVKMIVGVGLLAGMVAGLLFMGDGNAVRSMVQIEELKNEYQALDERVQRQSDDFVMRDLKAVNIYQQ